ncbi:hypothetical protein ACN20G_19490 [Streptomyces sp. BI20]|uniref:hypothetical protein n=1 Tax=Streptomyces sp. BI20 TaxID=3403460 RepID=UPI003C73BC4E
MTAPDTATATRPRPLDVERAEAAIVEHYPRLVRLAYLVLPPTLGRHRRVLTAHSLAQRALPRTRREKIPAPRTEEPAAGTAPADPGYAWVRSRVLRTALEAERPWHPRDKRLPHRSQLPPLLPQVRGLRLFPRAGGAEELALDQRLAALSGPGRAARALAALDGLDPQACARVLAEAGVADPDAALAEAAASAEPADDALLASAEFDPCVVQTRPSDLLRRRRYGRAAVAAAVALAVCAAIPLFGADGWGEDGAAAPLYARNAAAEAALDPARLIRGTAPDAWRTATRADWAAWPVRGDRADDTALLRRALAVWARPGPTVLTSATPQTPAGPPMGPARLLFAGTVDQAVVVLFHDGLRVVRYAEPLTGTAGAALDFARTDGARAADAGALVLSRVDGNVRYLTAPWVTKVSVRDLLKPEGVPTVLRSTPDGMTPPVPAPAPRGTCSSWNALTLSGPDGTRTVTDLGELTPARLTSGAPGSPRELTGNTDLTEWSKTACLLPSVRSHGVRTVNSWAYATQALPGGEGSAAWLCARAETWSGVGERAQVQFLAPGAPMAAQAARAEDSPACGVREPKVLAGVLWKSRAGQWYVLAAGSPVVTSVSVTGAVTGASAGPLLAEKAPAGARVELSGRVANGTRFGALR